MPINTQKYNVLPSGIIQSGTAVISADTDTGEITYEATVFAKVLFVKKTVNVADKLGVPPIDLRSSNITKVGQIIQIESVSLSVLSINAGSCDVSINVDGQNITGTAIVDTSQEFISINSASVKAKVSGFNVSINVEKA